MRLLEHITYRDPAAADCLILLDGRVLRGCQIARGGPEGYAVVQYTHPGFPGVAMTEIVWGHVEIYPDWRAYMRDRPEAPFFDLDRHLSGQPQAGVTPAQVSVIETAPEPADRSLDRWRWRVVRRGALAAVEQGDPHPVYPDRGTSSDFTLLRDHGDPRVPPGAPETVAAVVLEPSRPGEPRVILEVQPGEQPRRFNRRYIDGSGQPVGTAWCLELAVGAPVGAAHDDVETVDRLKFWAFFRPDGSVVLSTNPEASECGLGVKDAVMYASVQAGEVPITWTAHNRDFLASLEAVS